MLQFSKVLASLCAGCLCTLTIHQIPALGNVLLPQTHAIPETSPIRPVDVMPLEPLPTPAETAPAMSIPPTETQPLLQYRPKPQLPRSRKQLSQ